MELQQLIYFQQVAHSENITRTAGDLRVSQPALSKMIRTLEEELGASLFDRKGKRIELNTRGKKFLKRVEAALNELNEARNEIQDEEGEVKGTIRLSFDVASSIIPNLIREFRTLHPDVTFQLSQHDTYTASTNFDLCVTSLPIGLHGTEKTVLLNEEIVLAVPKDNPLSNQASLRLEQIANEGLISLKRGRSLREKTDAFCKVAGFIPRITFESDDPATVRALIRAGQGISFIPSITWKGATDESIRLLRIEHPICSRSIELHWKKDHYLGQAARTFREFLIEYFHEAEARHIT
ncbi:LysR substrate-binding domain-containing protein [Paenibacillus sp. RC67]|uniref:LysR family transcriptional regulator n=1 Tax=Paenibacillus sp. RC67 TaxID=3039392 RepID=UPI0024ACE321|nr:LysR substrate-binding domain-containing protein [Paenibacillus sp. RC67]